MEGPEKRFSIRYEVLRELGRGSYGMVEEVQEQSTGSRYARKRFYFDKRKSREEIEKKVEEEVHIMRNLRHQNIVTLAAFLKESDSWSILIHPVADYDLKKYFEKCVEKEYDEAWTKRINEWFDCLLDALAFTHKHNIKHRDIKPRNILIKENEIYLCDFGLAKDFSGQDSSGSRGPKPEGTLEYRAPELRSDQQRGRSADVFSLGCVFSEMLTVINAESAEDFRKERQEKPFRDCLHEVREWVTKFKNSEHSRFLYWIINRMLQEDPNNRIKAETALDKIRKERRLQMSVRDPD